MPTKSIISSLLWSLVPEDLLHRLNEQEYRAFLYTDDLFIVATSKFSNTVLVVIIGSLRFERGWCKKHSLSNNNDDFGFFYLQDKT